MKPLICLAMIVRNEAHGIVSTLQAARPQVDSFCILDTGSTDGTPELVRRTLADLPGAVHEAAFVDFAASRNRCLDLAGDAATFTLMLDSDEILTGGARLRAFAEAVRDGGGLEHEAYLVERRDGDTAHFSARLLRAAAGWRYVGAVHEVPQRPGAPDPALRVPGAWLDVQAAAPSREASQSRWRRDLELLEAEHRHRPADARTTFYLGQTYECLDRVAEALACYRERVALGGWPEEAYEAAYRIARCAERLGRPWPEVQQLYLDAHARAPHRMEPLCRIAEHWHRADDHALAYLFAARGAAAPLPERDILFVERDVYEWRLADLAATHAFYIGELETGRRCAARAVRGRPLDPRLRHNLAFYAPAAAECFPGFRTRPIALPTAPPWTPSSPSVLVDGDRRCAVVRTVNYRIVDGRYCWSDGDTAVRTRNFWVDLAPDYGLAAVHEIADRSGLPRTDFPAHGFEDCRLFRWRDRDWLLATVCDLATMPDGDGAREMALLALDERHDVVEVRPLRGPWSDRHQKNWLPWVRGDGLSWIYSTDPLVRIEHSSGSESTIVGALPREAGRLRGGSPAVPVPGGWLWLVHETTANADGSARIYLHRFVLSDGTCVRAATPAFFFERRGIEFACGLARDGEDLVAGFSVNDSAACFGFVPLASVLARLEPWDDERQA